MKSLADMLGATLKQTGSAGALKPLWDRAVGELVARHTRPIRWEGAKLIVRCDAPAWRDALQAELPQIAKRLATAMGEARAPEIVLEVA